MNGSLAQQSEIRKGGLSIAYAASGYAIEFWQMSSFCAAIFAIC